MASRSKNKKKYDVKYKDIPVDNIDRLYHYVDILKLSDKDIDYINNEIERIDNIEEEIIHYKLLEIPLPSDRPRKNNSMQHFYVNNNTINKKVMDSIRKEEEIHNIIITSTTVILEYYLPIPNDMNKRDKILAELGYIEPYIPPDVDNIYKTYTDMMNGKIILDDRLIVRTIINKRYSFKPRVEVFIKYKKEFDCKYNEKKIKKSKTYASLIGGE